MFPIVLLLALSGVVVGMLNSFEHFAVPALAPVAWNLVIIAALVGLVPVMPEGDEIYAYAIGILAGTVVQFLLPLPWLRGRGGQLTFRLDWRDPRVRRVLKLMLPVTIALGLINLEPADQLVVRHARLRPGPGGDRQGVPHLHAAAGAVLDVDRDDPVPDAVALRRARRPRRPAPHDGQRRAPDLPAADPERGGDGRAGRADHPARLPARRVRRRMPPTSRRPRWCGGRSRCPFQGVSLLFSRTFFSLQRPWATTALAGLNLVRERGAGGGAVRAVRHRGDRARHRGGDRDDVRGAGLAAAPRPRRGGGRADARRGGADAGGRARCWAGWPTGSGTGWTPRWGGA